MKGRVLGFDTRTGEGMISSEDGQRFPFAPDDWKQRIPPQTGQIVDFEVYQDRAKAIYVLGGNRAIVADKNRFVAALLAFFLGSLGIHKFYLGKTTAGVIMLLGGTIGWLLVVPGLLVCLVAFVEFIIYLVTSDENFHTKYVEGDAAWF